MNITAFQEMARALVDQHGLIDWRVGLSRGLASGYLARTLHKSKCIDVKKCIVQVNSEGTLKTIVLHEIAHALVRPQEAHGDEWQAKARGIGCEYVSAYAPPSTLVPSWWAECDCGWDHSWFRKPRWFTNLKSLGGCPRCRGPISGLMFRPVSKAAEARMRRRMKKSLEGGLPI